MLSAGGEKGGGGRDTRNAEGEFANRGVEGGLRTRGGKKVEEEEVTREEGFRSRNRGEKWAEEKGGLKGNRRGRGGRKKTRIAEEGRC